MTKSMIFMRPRQSWHTALLVMLSGLFVLFGFAGQARAASFYDQPPMTEQEFIKFIDDLPTYRSWARQEKELAHPSLSKEGRPDFIYSSKAAAKAKDMGWEPKRFFCIMGRAAAALSLQAKGNPGADKPVDMPVVSPAEFKIVRRHLDALRDAGEKK